MFLDRNFTLMAKRYDVSQAEAQVLQARLYDNPVISVEENLYNSITKKFFDFGKMSEQAVEVAQVVPISIIIIFIILFVMFSNVRDAALVLCNVPFAAVGGILALLITNFNFSISAGIGFIALFGICIQNGVIMISDIKQNLREKVPLAQSVKNGVRSRVRPVIMTAAMATIGLLPAATSHGIGSESQRPLAIVINRWIDWSNICIICFSFDHRGCI